MKKEQISEQEDPVNICCLSEVRLADERGQKISYN